MTEQELRIECPHCRTSYTLARCGLALRNDKLIATIGCGLCQQSFNVAVVPVTTQHVTTQPGWWARVVLRKKPEVVETVEHTISTSVRE